ncbi:B12-binding domain-containing radical SAM protein [Maribellus sediminis]|uniref:B12-binding domain-containing radical SAM protein n=1 Tax=Maribellus sediminis TaxID=2696285 RepID=UPI00142FA945|nr:radical SAM protein [Maribellus sediminis]
MEKRPLKFVLINPTSPLWRVNSNQKPVNHSVFRFSMLPSLYVAASLPRHVQTQIIDEDVEPIDFDTDADIIGVSFMTYNAPRAYEIGDRFRAKGKAVIFGGYHPSFMPEEAIQHSDAVCIGEAEYNIPNMIADFQNGGLQQFYKSELVDLADLPHLNRNLIKRNAYVTPNAMQATRGCVHHCEFCSVASFNRYKIRTRPVGDVVKELGTLGRYVLFMDDNIILNKAYAKELFKAMIPLKKRWFSQCGIGIAEDEELLRLAAQSGCRGLFIGFESLSEQTLSAYQKHCNRQKDYLDIVKQIHAAGIGICAGFVFGSDEDGPDVFENTLEFLQKSNMDALQSTRLTPFPGTPLFNRMDEEGRILDKDWSHYDFFHVVHQPIQMSAATLHEGTAWLQREFYSYPSISRRMSKAISYLSPETLLKAVIPLNLGWRFKLTSYGAFKMGNYLEKEQLA